MSVISKASLVLIPSGYGEDILYSEVPNTTAGDFTFTRASSGTRVNADGYIETAEVISTTELVTNGDFATDSDWSKGSGWTISGGTANQDNSTPNSGDLTQSNVTTSGKIYKVTFDLVVTSGTISAIVGGHNLFTSSGTKTFIKTATSSNLTFRNYSNFIGSIDNVSVKEVAQNNVPRLDYSGGASCPTLLLEGQSTNLLPYSSDFSQWNATGGAATSNYGISPDGTQNSTRYVFSGQNKALRYSVSTSTSTTGSIYIKGTSGETIKFGLSSTQSIFTLNGSWQRIQKEDSSGTSIIVLSTYSGATARDVEIWGGQLEQGILTSYIPTSGTSVTRVKDTCELTNNATLPTDYPFALYFEADMNENSNWYISFLNNASNSQYAGIYSAGGTRFIAANRMQGPNNLCYSNYLSYGIHKVAAYFENETTIKLFVDGTLETTQTITLTSFNTNVNDLYLGQLRTIDTTRTSVKSAYIFNEALTDSELEELTTI